MFVEDFVVPRIKQLELFNRIARDGSSSIVSKDGCGSVDYVVVDTVAELKMSGDTACSSFVAPSRLGGPRRDVELVFPDRAHSKDARVGPKEHVVVSGNAEDVLLDVIANRVVKGEVIDSLKWVQSGRMQDRRVCIEGVTEVP